MCQGQLWMLGPQEQKSQPRALPSWRSQSAEGKTADQQVKNEARFVIRQLLEWRVSGWVGLV